MSARVLPSAGTPVAGTARRRTRAFAWGENGTGALGLGHLARVQQPVPAYLPPRTVDIAGGDDFTLVRTDDGAVYAWGGNAHGQLGAADHADRLTPLRVELPPVVAIAAGADHALALTGAGEVFVWGGARSARLGAGEEDCAAPRLLVEHGAVAISAGRGESAVLFEAGAIRRWGRFDPNEIVIEGAARLACSRAHLVVATVVGRLVTLGPFGVGATARLRERVLSPECGGVRSVRAGDDFTLAITTRGALLAWGDNAYGQLGQGDRRPRSEPVPVRLPAGGADDDADFVVEAVAGARSAAALTAGGAVYTWGETRLGQGGRGAGGADQLTPVRIDALRGARLTGLSGGAAHLIAVATSGPIAALRLLPQRVTVASGEPVTFEARAVDAFGTDLGPVDGLNGLDEVALEVAAGEVDALTVRVRTPGRYRVTVRAGELQDAAALIVVDPRPGVRPRELR